jgi:hypothetical protein
VTSELIDPLYLAACTTGVGFAHWRVWACTVPAFAANRHSRARTLLAVAGWMLLALAAPAGLLMALVGIEELAGTPLCPSASPSPPSASPRSSFSPASPRSRPPRGALVAMSLNR